MKIGIDIDDSLTQTSIRIIEWHNAAYGTTLTYEDVTTQQFSELFKITKEETTRRVNEWFATGAILTLEPMLGVPETLPQIASMYDVYFVTARLPNRATATKAWLSKYLTGVEEKIHYAFNPYRGSGGKTKLEICKELGIELLIEDSEAFAVECAEAGITVLLLNHPWNRHIDHPNVYRVNDWFEIQTWLTNYKQQ